MKRCLVVFDSGFGYGDSFLSIPTILRLKEQGYSIRLITKERNIPIYQLLPPDTFERLCHMNNQQHFFTNDFDKVINGQYWWYNGRVCNFKMNVIDYFGVYNRVFKEEFKDEFDGYFGMLPDLRLHRKELEKAQDLINSVSQGKPTILYQSLISFWNKMLEPNKWQEIIDKLHKDFCIIQVGAAFNLNHTINLSEKTSIIESIALASECDLLLGGDSWMNHASGFVKTPGVFVWCSTSPEDYGYDWNYNIWHPEVNDCLPCGRPFRWCYDYDYPNQNSYERSEAGWVCPKKFCSAAITPDEIVSQVYNLYENKDNIDWNFRDYIKAEDTKIAPIEVKNKISVSFILVVYDKLDKLDAVIEGIREHCPYEYKIILVDNNNNDLGNVIGKQDDIELLLAEENLGYSGGNNEGMREALKGESDYFIIINPDLIITDEKCILNLIASSGEDCISGKLVGTDSWYTYPASFPTYRMAGKIPYFYDKPTHNLSGWKPFPYIDGSLVCIPRNIFIDTDGYDESLPELVYFDEAPLLFKSYLKGYKINDAKIDGMFDHQHTDYDTGNVAKWTEINRQYFYEKYALPNWESFLAYLSGDCIKTQ